MIVSIKIQNFLSFGNETITLHPDSNLIAGINGGGKTNFLQAVRLLKAAVSERNGLQSLLATLGGIDEVLNMVSDVQEMVLTYELDKNVFVDYTKNILYKIVISKINDKNKRFVVNHFLGFDLGGKIEFKEIEEGKFKIKEMDKQYFTDTITKIMAQQDIGNDEKRIRYDVYMGFMANSSDFFTPILTAIENMDIYTHFDTTPKSLLRRPMIDTSFENKLLEDGTNLPQILNQLSINHLDAFDKIAEELKSVNPNFKEIRFNYLASTILMTLREKDLKSTVNCNRLSDGTLRFLCLLAILCNPTPSSLICLDEPEMGLHPDMIATLARLITEKSKTTQIVIITHSPLLLNHFNFENVLFFEKNEVNNTIQRRYNADDFAENEMVGSLWMKGYLGGRRW